ARFAARNKPRGREPGFRECQEEREWIADARKHVRRVAPDFALGRKLADDVWVVLQAAGVEHRTWRKALCEFRNGVWILIRRADDAIRDAFEVAVGEQINRPCRVAGAGERMNRCPRAGTDNANSGHSSSSAGRPMNRRIDWSCGIIITRMTSA